MREYADDWSGNSQAHLGCTAAPSQRVGRLTEAAAEASLSVPDGEEREIVAADGTVGYLPGQAVSASERIATEVSQRAMGLEIDRIILDRFSCREFSNRV